MLAISCPICSCILLEDRTKKKYCIGCSEVDDGDTTKDNPAVNELAARKTVEENQHRMSNQPLLITETRTNPHPTTNQVHDSTEVVSSNHSNKTPTTNSSIDRKS